MARVVRKTEGVRDERGEEEDGHIEAIGQHT